MVETYFKHILVHYLACHFHFSYPANTLLLYVLIYVDRYSRCLAHYPFVIIVAVAVVTIVCVVVMVICGSTPAFSDPKLVSNCLVC